MQGYQNYFPASYQPFNPYQQYQNQFQQNFQQSVQNQQFQPAQQSLTPPTIHAEIIQIDGGIKEVESYPVNAGCSQMFIAKDEQTIFIKSVLANGQYTIDEYQKKEPEPEQETNLLENYVTIDMLNSRLSEIVSSFSQQQNQTKSSRKSDKREDVADNEHV
jgi:hypothetical protein